MPTKRKIQHRGLFEKVKKDIEANEKKLKKNRLKQITPFSIFSLIIIAFLLFDSYYQHKNRINEIKEMTSNFREVVKLNNELDSINKLSIKKLEKNLAIAISNCKFLKDGKEITAEELIKYTNKTNDDLYSYKDSLYAMKSLKDTLLKRHMEQRIKINRQHKQLSISNQKLELMRKSYGVVFSITNDSSMLTMSSQKLDSAMVLLRHFKNKIRKDKDGYWIVDKY